jgi:type II secretion system protein N
MIKIDRAKLIRTALLAGYFVAVFLTFAVLQFPYDRIKSRLEYEVRTRTPLELSIVRISPRFLNRFVLTDIVLSDREGKVLFESPLVRTHVSLLGFLRGALSVGLKGPAYGGELAVKAEEGPKRRFLSVDASGLDIGSYGLLKQMGLKISGKVGGSFEMTNDAGKGRFWVKDLACRELTVQGFPVPDFDFQQGWIEAETKGDRLTVKKLEMDGKELKVRISGDAVMRERGYLNLVVKLKPSERLAQEQSGLLSLIKNRDAEGFYQFSLGGTLSGPVPRL